MADYSCVVGYSSGIVESQLCGPTPRVQMPGYELVLHRLGRRCRFARIIVITVVMLSLISSMAKKITEKNLIRWIVFNIKSITFASFLI